MLKDKLGVDDKDAKLLTLLMRDPDISQHELAQRLRLSQPSVNARLRKLKDRGVVAHAVGLDAKRAGITLARVDFTCSDAERVLGVLQHCSFFINGFVMSGTRNASAFLVGEDLRKIEHIVNQYLRSSPKVSDIEIDVVVTMAKEFICSIDLEKEHTTPCADPESCKDCAILREMRG
ncbi:Lrp/AsnC family transcriptional regulator [Candidatus Woesearchaeota archaeon]|nr:Lrp/AsnC family transcriptional regulator [Candidatus Woesearchaeota archaeon]